MLAKNTARGKKRARADTASYWISYSDMMVSLLLMFVLLLFLSFNRYISLQETKEAELAVQAATLAEQQEALTASQNAVQQREQELTALRYTLNAQRITMDEQQLALGEKESALQSKQTELDESLAELELSQARLILQQSTIEDQQRLLSISQEEIDAARAQLDAYSTELEGREIVLSAKDAELIVEKLRVADLETLLTEQKGQLEGQVALIDELVGVRSRIITQLRDAFKAEGLNVSVDATGAITMDSTVFFDTDQTYLKSEGRMLLAQLLPVYYHTMMRPENADFVAEIIVEGHTDSDGSYEHNLNLSQLRAQEVVTFCMSNEFEGLNQAEKLQLRAMITANGRSESQLIYNADGTENKAASRRVEIKFRLKETEMIESMSRIFAEMGIDEGDEAR